MHDLPPSSTNGSLSLSTLCEEIFTLARENYQQNQLFIPILTTLEIILDDELSAALSETSSGLEMFVNRSDLLAQTQLNTVFDSLNRILNLAGRNADKLKSVPRVLACMKMCVSVFVDRLPKSYMP